MEELPYSENEMEVEDIEDVELEFKSGGKKLKKSKKKRDVYKKTRKKHNKKINIENSYSSKKLIKNKKQEKKIIKKREKQ